MSKIHLLCDKDTHYAFVIRKTMKKIFLLIMLAVVLPNVRAMVPVIMNEPDSAYIFAYATETHQGRNGLHYAWSRDAQTWHPIGPEYAYVRCDWGRWGVEKRMLKPFLFPGKEGEWHCVWSLNEEVGQIAYTTSADLVFWWRQSYPEVTTQANCLDLEVTGGNGEEPFRLTWISTAQNTAKAYQTTTFDFKTFTPVQPFPLTERANLRRKAFISGKEEEGTLHKVSWEQIDVLIEAYKLAAFKTIQNSEVTKDDPVRFAGLETVKATINIDPAQSKAISDMLIGIFFEDINYAADGGLYAELIQNRDFEYDPSDREGRDPAWNHQTAWHLTGDGASWKVETHDPIHANNPHYALLSVESPGAALVNEGFDGIPVRAGEKYDLSLFARMPEGGSGRLKIRLVEDGRSLAETTLSVPSGKWKKIQAVLTPKVTARQATLEIIPQAPGDYALDMVSLFPQNTFKARKNGLRADLAQTLADMKPRFVRFPGGCVAHGDGLHNIYQWKNTIGPLEARVPQRNLWGYHQTAGLGYFEYFQFCEDIGAEPVPVIAAGVPCQNSATGGGGQQGGIPMCEMDSYIQDILDLIEWANGDDRTTVWGRKRAEAGHPKPFNLKYLGIGNEDQITDVFEERFEMIYNAIREKHPEIIVIGTVGPFYEGTDYIEGWQLATRLSVPVVDEHYYNPPGWFIHNQDYYDRYDRNKSKVYLGEYAAHLPGRPNNIETALAEALFLTAVERNADIVPMTSYAPLLAKEGHTQWNPDLIYFNNTEVKPTVGYYVQQLYGQHAGDCYLPSCVTLTDNRESVRKRFAVSTVRDSRTNDLIIKMVNLLPVSVSPDIDLSFLGTTQTEATLTTLTGAPDDLQARPETFSIRLSGSFNEEIPPYSFIVLRIKN